MRVFTTPSEGRKSLRALHAHFSAGAAETALPGQAGALQCGKSAGAA